MAERKLFEEVSDRGAVPAPVRGGLIDGPGTGARGATRWWLIGLFVLVSVMILVGGLTRLTDSGLSITEWQPIMGAIPPLSEADWVAVFDKYKATPEFQLQNSAMEMAAFKTIFWWEWGHRFLGRVIGLYWGIGFVALLATRRMPRGWTTRLLVLGALGGLQGAIGWWMVHSGLSGDRVDVASYRLALHLGLAFVILGLTAWAILDLSRSEAALLQARRAAEPGLKGLSTGLLHATFLQILLGALVAGIDAGRGFPTWPDMNGSFFPADAFYVPGGSAWQAFFENAGLVQFNHRMLGYLVAVMAVVAFFRARRSPVGATRFAFALVLAAVAVQVALGIFAALTAAHLHVAITHQLGAILLWVLVIRARHQSIHPRQGSIRDGSL